MDGSESRCHHLSSSSGLRRPEIDKAATPSGVRSWLSEVLFPVAAQKAAPLELTVVFLLGAMAAFFRLGDVGLRGNLWAEDGKEFLQRALLHSEITQVFDPYAGYMHLLPRLVAMLVAALPLPSQGVALNVTAAAVQAAVATLAYVGTSGFIEQRLWRAILALAVVAVPVGPEVPDSIANLQWFLLFAGCVCIFWTPRRALGWGVLGGVLLTTTMSTPFAVIFVAGAVVRLLVQRSRAAMVIAGLAGTGFAIQTMVMVMAPARTGASQFGVDVTPARFVAGLVRRVLGDGVFGTGRHPVGQSAPGLQAGVVVAILLAVLVLCIATNDRFTVVARAGLFGLLAILTYGMPVVASPSVTTENPFYFGRYYVAPALLSVAAVMCVVGGVLDVRRLATLRFRWVAFPVCGVLVVSLLWGLGSSWTVGRVIGRQNGPSWQRGIEDARRACATSSADALVKVPVSPGTSTVRVPCARLRE
jgi:hypothetical protein